MDLKPHIRTVPDFPKPGILFYDISTLLAHPAAWRACVDQLAAAGRPHAPDLVTAPLALELGCGFAMVRKAGKLPGATRPHTYDLEYGTDTIEVQDGIIPPGSRVVVMDDLLATGGTLAAAIALTREIGAEVVAATCIIELSFLEGRKRIDVPFSSILSYESQDSA
jgi:adenine phosphoribosyltransferase